VRKRKQGIEKSLIQIGVVNREKHKSMLTAAGALFFIKEPQMVHVVV